MYEDAKSRGCAIMVLSSGGNLTEMASSDGYMVYHAEAGFQPRMALGYSLTTLLMIMGELCGIEVRNSLLEVEQKLIHNHDLKSLADNMFDRFKTHLQQKFVVVCDLPFEAVATRFCQQIQENAKGEAFISVIPEANHNMIESYYSKRDTNFLFINSGLNARINLRFEYLKSVLEKRGNLIFEYPTGTFGFQALYEVIHATDWLSISISSEKKENNMEVQIISGLKEYLDKN
jgi:glucose/mannose-6-phosphate isomerase